MLFCTNSQSLVLVIQVNSCWCFSLPREEPFCRRCSQAHRSSGLSRAVAVSSLGSAPLSPSLEISPCGKEGSCCHLVEPLPPGPGLPRGLQSLPPSASTARGNAEQPHTSLLHFLGFSTGLDGLAPSRPFPLFHHWQSSTHIPAASQHAQKWHLSPHTSKTPL